MAKLKNEETIDFADIINSEMGAGTIMVGDTVLDIESVTTGSLAMDIALGVGGMPKGRVVEIYGPESSGKTTTALMAIANTQAQGGKAFFVDVEHALDPTWAKALGVNTDEMHIAQPDYGEQALNLVLKSLNMKAHDIIVIDSVAALVPKEELEGDFEKIVMGGLARMMSKYLKRIAIAASNANCTVIFLNQIRMKLGMVFGNPETTPGGNALKFGASLRIEVRAGKAIKDGEVVVGKGMKIKVVKNKCAPPFRTAEVHLMFDTSNHIYGFDPHSETISMAEAAGILKKSGSWYSYKETKLGMGITNAANFLRDEHNKGLYTEIRDLVKEKHALIPGQIVVQDDLVSEVDQALKDQDTDVDKDAENIIKEITK